MKLLRTFVLLLALLGFKKSDAQSNVLYVIKLKSGLQIKAELLKVVPDSFVMVRQYDLESKIQMSEIAEITQAAPLLNPYQYAYQQPRGQGGRMSNYVKRNIPDTGWRFALQFGASFGSKGYDPSSSFVFRFSILKARKQLLYGLNFGLDPYYYAGTAILAVAPEARLHFSKNSTSSFFLNTNAGYGFNLSSPRLGSDGGFLFSPGLGRSTRTRDGNIFSFLVSYKFQKFKSEVESWNGWGGMITRRQNYEMNRIEFKVEWRF